MQDDAQGNAGVWMLPAGIGHGHRAREHLWRGFPSLGIVDSGAGRGVGGDKRRYKGDTKNVSTGSFLVPVSPGSNFAPGLKTLLPSRVVFPAPLCST